MTSSPSTPARATGAAGPPDPPVGVPVGTLLVGLLGGLLVVAGSLGAGGVLVADPGPGDPVLGDGPLSVLRYGHGHDLAVAVVYLGVGLLVWAWLRLGRAVLAGQARGRAVLACAAAWMLPMLGAPPLFSRDAYVYLAQGALAWHGFDPYAVGPEVLAAPITANVDSLWQATPSPYGPLFLLLAKGVAGLTGGGLVGGVVLMRLALLPGLALLVWALPGLARHLGGRTSVALWLAVANPLTVVQLVGGPHNDLLGIGLLAAGTLLVLEHRHVAGLALVALAVAVKATVGMALPFLVLVWAARLPGRRWARLAAAGAASAVIVLATYLAADLALGVRPGDLPALTAPSLIVNWLSLPTGVGLLAHGALGWLVGVGEQPFVRVTRLVGLGLLVVVAAWQSWRARDGGPPAVRRAAGVLLLTAALGPATLPWYFSWGLALGAGLPWHRRGLALAAGGSVALMLLAYPNGEGAYSNWLYLLAGAALCALAAASLCRSEPLGLSPPKATASTIPT